MTTLNRIYPDELQQQVIKEVKDNNRLISDVAKQYNVSAKTIYQWVKKRKQPLKSVSKQQDLATEIATEIANLQKRLFQLNQELVSVKGH
ncbi:MULTISPECIES: transposase [Shewanella]|uniref:Transposase n=2 Tax=Shewanellaceae TaxID=267890 RepID=A0ABM6JQI1_9GAMM|nr:MULTISPECIES: transposase [Shewanella]ARD23891.1 hypothetical protein SJ2017_3645 [Shewanella japonica]KPZ72221.1 Transposase [Shewanella sp. P1-14-1]MBQ4889416.1 transposase [Shewanella sp. MMG014]